MLTRVRTDTGPPRRPPSATRRFGRMVLMGLALLVVGQGFGCSNYRSFRDPVALNPCNPCEPAAVVPPPQDNIFRRIGRRLFGPRDPVPMVAAAPIASDCGPAAIVGAPAVVAAPTVVGVPAAAVPAMGAPVAVPAGPGGVPVPQGARPAGPPPDEDNSGLQEAPGLSPRSGSTPAGGGNGNSKTNYQSMKPPARKAAEGLARGNANEPAPGPARTPASDGGGAVGRVLDQLPVPSLGNGERVTAHRPENPPQPLDSELRDRLNQARPAPAAEPAPEPVTVTAEPPPRSDEAPSTIAVGISPFRILDSGIAGGGMPSVDGFAWLHEKGYRTFVDLRDAADVSAGEVAELNRLGLKHVRIPLNPKTIDADALAKFEEVLADKAARPVYFCDAQGNRAGLAWYLHRVVVDRMAPDLASREAEQIGLTDHKLLLNASEYLRRKKAGADPADERPDVPPPPPLGDVQDLDPSSLAPAFPEPSLPDDLADHSRPGTSWEAYTMPMAALLCAPLAFWGRTAIASTFRTIARASLPAPARSTRSLPRA